MNRKGDLPHNRQVGSLIELPTPCRQHVVFCPAQLGIAAKDEHRYHTFHTSCECGRAYLVALQDDGAHLRVEASPEAISELCEATPWPEQVLEEENGVFFYKEAPSLADLRSYYERN
jgi:hypothetical protein